MAKSKKKKTSPAKASKKPAAKSKPAVKKATTPSKKVSKMDYSSVFTPLEDRLLVMVEEMERRTPGGLYLPDTMADSSGNMRGEVVSVGRGRRDKKGRVHPMDVNVGDRVVFSQYTGNKIKLMDQDLVILREIDVMGVVTK